MNDLTNNSFRHLFIGLDKKVPIYNNNKIIVTSIDSLTSIYTPKNLFMEYNIRLKVDDDVDFKELSRKLLECGYERVEEEKKKTGAGTACGRCQALVQNVIDLGR